MSSIFECHWSVSKFGLDTDIQLSHGKFVRREEKKHENENVCEVKVFG